MSKKEARLYLEALSSHAPWRKPHAEPDGGTSCEYGQHCEAGFVAHPETEQCAKRERTGDDPPVHHELTTAGDLRCAPIGAELRELEIEQADPAIAACTRDCDHD